MRHPLPSFPPYFAPGLWWRAYLARKISGLSDSLAIREANESSGIKPRDWMRLHLENEVLLSVPVEGGASALKNRDSSTWRLSGNFGREHRKICSTLSTLYGRYPYFAPVSDLLQAGDAESAEDLCRKSFEGVKHFLALDDENLIAGIRDRLHAKDERLEGLTRQNADAFNANLSIVPTLMKLGPDAIFPLIPTF